MSQDELIRHLEETAVAVEQFLSETPTLYDVTREDLQQLERDLKSLKWHLKSI